MPPGESRARLFAEAELANTACGQGWGVAAFDSPRLRGGGQRALGRKQVSSRESDGAGIA